MEKNWFKHLTNDDISSDRLIPKWLKDGVNDPNYIIIEKMVYEIKCDLLEKQIKELRDKTKTLETVSITNLSNYRNDVKDRDHIINGLESKITEMKKNRERAEELLKDLQMKYEELKKKCDDIRTFV